MSRSDDICITSRENIVDFRDAPENINTVRGVECCVVWWSGGVLWCGEVVEYCGVVEWWSLVEW